MGSLKLATSMSDQISSGAARQLRRFNLRRSLRRYSVILMLRNLASSLAPQFPSMAKSVLQIKSWRPGHPAMLLTRASFSHANATGKDGWVISISHAFPCLRDLSNRNLQDAASQHNATGVLAYLARTDNSCLAPHLLRWSHRTCGRSKAASQVFLSLHE